MAKFTIKDLAEGRCAVKNDGTVEELNKVLKAAFPVKNQPAIGSSDIYFKINGGFWTSGCDTKLPVQSVKDFLALMQLRQLRKAWVGSWEQPDHNTIISAITYYISDGRVIIMTGNFWNSLALSFPTRKMAVDFFECFRGLCETAKTLL